MGFCTSCGAGISENVQICGNCGKMAAGTVLNPMAEEEIKSAKTKAGWSLGLGISALVCCGLACIPGLILGISSRKVLKQYGQPEGMATGGIICSAIGLGLWVLGTIAYILIFGAAVFASL